VHLVRNRERIVSKDELIGIIWGGRAISDSTIASRVAAARRAVGDSGGDQRVIRTLNRIGFRFVSHVAEAKGEAGTSAYGKTTADEPRPPTLLVHAFREDGCARIAFADALVEDLATALYQYSWLSIVLHRRTRQPGNWALGIGDAEPATATHFLLEGSVRHSKDSVRVTAQLFDPASGALLWAKRFDARRDESDNLQSEIAENISGVLGPQLELIASERAKREPLAFSDPHRHYLLGMGKLYRWNRTGLDEALRLFRRAVDFDPEFAAALGMAAYCYVQRKSNGWLTERAQEATECAQLAKRAAHCARDDAFALTKAAHAIASVPGDIDTGAEFVERALRINADLALAWYVKGWIELFRGRPKMAVDDLQHALQLGELDPLAFKMQAAMAYAQFLTGQYDEAAVLAERALCGRPYYLTAVRAAAASHASAGRLARAHGMMAQMCVRDPRLRVATLPDLIPFHRESDLDRWSSALSKAGLPD